MKIFSGFFCSIYPEEDKVKTDKLNTENLLVRAKFSGIIIKLQTQSYKQNQSRRKRMRKYNHQKDKKAEEKKKHRKNRKNI